MRLVLLGKLTILESLTLLDRLTLPAITRFSNAVRPTTPAASPRSTCLHLPICRASKRNDAWQRLLLESLTLLETLTTPGKTHLADGNGATGNCRTCAPHCWERCLFA